jgi:hypothetical protein
MGDKRDRREFEVSRDKHERSPFRNLDEFFRKKVVR